MNIETLSDNDLLILRRISSFIELDNETLDYAKTTFADLGLTDDAQYNQSVTLAYLDNNPQLAEAVSVAMPAEELECFSKFTKKDDALWIDFPQTMSSGAESTDAILAKDLPLPAWIVDNMIPVGDLSYFVSDGGIGKSWLALWLTETLTNGGRTFLGKYCEPCDVVYIDMELSEAWYASRVKMINEGLQELGVIRGRDNRHQCYRLGMPRLDFADADEFLSRTKEDQEQRLTKSADYLRFLVQKHNAKLLIIDPLVNLLGGKVEDRAEEMQPICDMLKRLAMDLNIAVLVLHHTRKDAPIARGSGAIRNSAASMFIFSRDDNLSETTRVMTTSKNRHGREESQQTLEFTWQDGMFTVIRLSSDAIAEAKAEKSNQEYQEILDAMIAKLEKAKAFTYKKGQLKEYLHDVTNASYNTINAALDRAISDGDVATSEPGGVGNPMYFATNEEVN